MLGSRSGYVRRVEDIAGNGAGLAVGADWRAGGAVGGTGRRALGCAAGFDIPAQDLRAALEAFDTATGISVLYGSDLSAGRRSSALRGHYAPDAALRLLLEGTGLIAQAVGDKAFVLRPTPSAQSGGAVSAQARHRRAFEAQLQQRVLDALCRQPASAPGIYRAALALRVDRQGQIGSVRLLDSTGSAARDAAIRAALQGLPVGEPSGDPGKAYVVLVLPRESRKPADCASAPSLLACIPCTLHGARMSAPGFSALRDLIVQRYDDTQAPPHAPARLGRSGGRGAAIPGCVLNSRSPTGRRRRR